MRNRLKLMRILGKWSASLAGLAVLLIAIAYYSQSTRQHRYHLRMTAGSPLGTRHKLAQLMQGELAGQGIELQLVGTAGSEEALDKVDSHELDVALIQGGLQVDDRPRVRQVSTLHVEPLHLLVRKELAESVSAHLAALARKKVNLGEVGSGTHSLAQEVLDFAGLRQRGPDNPDGYTPMTLSSRQLLGEKDKARLPDAIFMVSSLPSDVVHSLVVNCGYRLVALPFGEAFALQSRGVSDSGEATAFHGHHIDKGRTYTTSIPAFTYSLDPPVPAALLPTLGSRLLLVAHKDVDPLAARKLVEGTFAAEYAKNSRPPLDARLMDLPPEFPWHEGSRLYRERNQPIVSGQMMDSMHKGFAILAAVASGLFVLWQWSKQRAQFTLAGGFTKYIDQVARIEEQARRLENDPSGALTELQGIREKLGLLKTEALHRFAEGELMGKELLSGFLLLVNDARDFVTCLIDQASGQVREPCEKQHPPLVEASKVG
jgi:TRAP-type uncharacterized transport system substrate-binding protein